MTALSAPDVRRHFELTIAYWPLPAILTDHLIADQPIVAANRAFLEMTGYKAQEVLGRNCRFLGGPRTEPEARRAIRQALAKSRPAFVELTNYRKSGRIFRNGLSLMPIRGEGGKAVLYLGTQVDLTLAKARGGSRFTRSAELVESLSPRLREVLNFMLAGYRNQEMADALGLSIKTVKMHRARLMVVLGVKTTAQAIRIGIEAEMPIES